MSFINMFTAAGSGGNGGGYRDPKAIREPKVIMKYRMVNGDKSLFRQWDQRFVTALGQVEGSHDEIIQHLVNETDLGKELDQVVEELRITCGGEFARVSGDLWNILMDKV